MTPPPSLSSRPPRRRPQEDGVAIILVLAFLVLLTGVVVAFFSRAITERQVANSTLNQSKADLLARSAVDVLVGDLKQEIIDGSVKPASTPAPGVTLYLPKVAANMLPQTSGTPAPSPAGTVVIPNLVRRSVRSDPLAQSPPPAPAFKAVTTSASAVNSTTDVSANGRSISLARWNSHYLIPRHDTGVTIDSTPISPVATPVGPGDPTGFTPPDWVMMSKNGPAVLNTPPDKLAMAEVTGRYAYAIYDEGGLLDVNVAGYPQASPAPTTAPVVPYKSSLAFANLTAMPLNAAGTTFLPQAQVDSLVGWRNFASAQPDGGFGAYTFKPIAAERYNKFVLGSSSGFLTVNPQPTPFPVTPASRTDQTFTSRQTLLSYRRATGFSQNALQFLGTFNRDLNQPSLAPSTSRPKVKDIASGGNDVGDSAGSGTAEDAVNPSFLTVRVPGTDPTKLAANFKRSDGSPAMQTEPLVKDRFALNRLAWITYKGPSASWMGDPAVQQSITALGGDPTNPNDPVYLFVAQGTAQNIYNYFGLNWVVDSRAGAGAGQSIWVYNHEGTAPVASPSGSGQPIRSLAGSTNVASKNREPDFFELLKASIPVGAIGKAYHYTPPASQPSNYNATPEGYNQQRDNSIDAAIIQMGANIIDQFDYDGYPTRILFGDGRTFGGGIQEFRGVEDLPYLYGVREARVMTRDSNPPQSDLPQAGGTIVDPGQGVLLLQPEVWNPHAMQSASTSAPRPTSFRVLAATMDPQTETTTNYTVAVGWRQQNALPNPQPPPVATASASLNASVSFSIPSNRLDLFREPTLLAKPGVPSGSGFAGSATYTLPTPLFTAAYQYGANSVTDDRQYTGILLATLPMAFTTPMTKGGIVDLPEPPNPTNLNPPPTNDLPPVATTGIAPTGSVYFPTSGNSSPFPYVTYRMQYQFGGGSWITYDEKYASAPSGNSYNTTDFTTASGPGFAYHRNKTFYRTQDNPWANCAIGSLMAVMAMDPRSSRFGMTISGSTGRSVMSFTLPLTSSVGSTGDNRNPWNRFGWAAAPSTGTNATMQAAAKQMALMTSRPDEYQGAITSNQNGIPNSFGYDTGPTAGGWTPGGKSSVISPGLYTQNNPSISGSTLRYAGDQQPPSTPPQYFADPDGVVRRGTSAYVPTGASVAATAPSAGPWGLPLKTAYKYDAAGNATAIPSGNPNADEHLGRPMVLNRPFRSVTELGYVFSGTPWRSLDFATPESGAAGLLDAFCVSATPAGSNSLVAGRVNLNTRQIPVLQAILAGAYKDELNPVGAGLSAPMSAALAGSIASALVGRTATTAIAPQGPLTNLSELVGKWNGSIGAGSGTDGGKSYVGFTSDTVSPAPLPPKTIDLTGTLTSDTDKRIPRFRESAIRALAASGQTRVWNLMIDVVAQTGRYPQTATTLDKFNVEGEQRYWVHVAIDRYTGNVLDKQIEVVKE